MLGVQTYPVVLGDQVESMLCCWLSMQNQSSLIVIGASVERAFFCTRVGVSTARVFTRADLADLRFPAAHSRLSPGLGPRLSPRLIHRLHAGLAACRIVPVCARAQPEQPRVPWQRGKRRREQTGAVAGAASLTQDQLPSHPSPRSAHSLPETTPQFLPAASSSTISRRLPSRPELRRHSGERTGSARSSRYLSDARSISARPLSRLESSGDSCPSPYKGGRRREPRHRGVDFFGDSLGTLRADEASARRIGSSVESRRKRTSHRPVRVRPVTPRDLPVCRPEGPTCVAVRARPSLSGPRRCRMARMAT
jgi:hypothetical protein